ncbi:MAG: hypothetical protein QXE01_06175 [Sulfolobales archaeon]
MVIYREAVINTSKRREIIDITRYLEEIVKESGVFEGAETFLMLGGEVYICC